jgi:hypothetical protein
MYDVWEAAHSTGFLKSTGISSGHKGLAGRFELWHSRESMPFCAAAQSHRLPDRFDPDRFDPVRFDNDRIDLVMPD